MPAAMSSLPSTRGAIWRARWAVVLPAMLLSGCATMLRGTTDNLRIASTPEGASVALQRPLDEQVLDTGVTPASFKVSSKKELTILIEKPGYKPRKVGLESTLQLSSFFMDFLWGPAFVVALAVDFSNGAIYHHDECDVAVKLMPLPGS